MYRTIWLWEMVGSVVNGSLQGISHDVCRCPHMQSGQRDLQPDLVPVLLKHSVRDARKGQAGIAVVDTGSVHNVS